MKKLFTILAAVFFVTFTLTSPLYAAGGQNQGDVGKGEVDQGSTGSDIGNAQGSDAQGKQS